MSEEQETERSEITFLINNKIRSRFTSIQLKSLLRNISFYLLHTHANAHTYIYLTAEQSVFISRYRFNSLQPVSLIVKGKY